jgi:hypothetical protein
VPVRIAVVLAGALLVAGLGSGSASNQQETVLTVQVSSADHEVEEGYFSLGDEATVLAKPGTELFRFLSSHRGRTVKIRLVEERGRQLSTLHR